MKSYRNLVAKMGGALLLAGTFVLASASQADAALMVWICNDAACAGEAAVVDNGAGDVNPAAGAITVITGAGSVELATSYPFTGSPTSPFLNLTYSLGSADFAALGGTPFLFAAQDGFLLSPGTITMVANASNGGGTASAWSGTTPPGFTPATAGAPLLTCVMDCSVTGPAAAAPYYLAAGVAVTAGAGGAASGDVTLTVPEPASLALFGLGLAGLTALRRRKA